MGRPVQLIEILAEQTLPGNMRCEVCHGLGEILFPDQETGFDYEVCVACCGAGLNQLGFILQGILKPPPEGYGSVMLKEALWHYLKEQSENPNVSVKRWKCC